MYSHLAAGLLGAAVAATGAWQVQAWRFGAREADQLRTERAIKQAADASAQAAAKAISQIEVKHVTVRQQLEREIQTREVFRDCRSGPDAVSLLNRSPGIAPSASAPGGGQLPPAGATR